MLVNEKKKCTFFSPMRQLAFETKPLNQLALHTTTISITEPYESPGYYDK